MATAAAASLALRALIDELGALGPAEMDRIESARATLDARIERARLEAMAALAEAGRAAMLQTASEHLAVAALHSQVPQAIRAAAYDAALALLASDVVPPAVFRVLYEPWDQGSHDGMGSSALEHGEEVLLHID
jgi:hypothetical protein